MKNIKLGLVGLVVPVLWLISLTPVDAQTEVLIEPEDLIIVRSLDRTDSLALSPKSAIEIQTSEKQFQEIIAPAESNPEQAPDNRELEGKLRLNNRRTEENSGATHLKLSEIAFLKK